MGEKKEGKGFGDVQMENLAVDEGVYYLWCKKCGKIMEPEKDGEDIYFKCPCCGALVQEETEREIVDVGSFRAVKYSVSWLCLCVQNPLEEGKKEWADWRRTRLWTNLNCRICGRKYKLEIGLKPHIAARE